MSSDYVVTISERERDIVLDRRARIVLAEIYGISSKENIELPKFDLSNIDMGKVYTRPEAQPREEEQ